MNLPAGRVRERGDCPHVPGVDSRFSQQSGHRGKDTPASRPVQLVMQLLVQRYQQLTRPVGERMQMQFAPVQPVEHAKQTIARVIRETAARATEFKAAATIGLTGGRDIHVNQSGTRKSGRFGGYPAVMWASVWRPW